LVHSPDRPNTTLLPFCSLFLDTKIRYHHQKDAHPGTLNSTSFPNKDSLSRSGLQESILLVPTEAGKKAKINHLLIIWPHNVLTILAILVKRCGLFN